MPQSLLAERFKMVAHRDAAGADLLACPRQTGSPFEQQAHSRQQPRSHSGNEHPARERCERVVCHCRKFAECLSQVIGRVVIDGTALIHDFDFDLRWSNDLQDASTDAPSIFTALKEHLGLKLADTERPVDTSSSTTSSGPPETDMEDACQGTRHRRRRDSRFRPALRRAAHVCDGHSPVALVSLATLDLRLRLLPRILMTVTCAHDGEH